MFTNGGLIPGFKTGILYLCVSRFIYTLTIEQSAVGSAEQLRPGGADYRGSRIISLKAIIYYGAVRCRVGGAQLFLGGADYRGSRVISLKATMNYRSSPL